MTRFLLTAVVVLATSAVTQAHFVFLLPAPDGSSLKLVLSDELEVDDNIDAAKLTATKLFVREADGKDTPLTLKAAAHHIDAVVPGKGPRLVYGTTEYGVLQKGDAPAFQLKYHSKAVLGAVTEKTAKIGAAVPVEIVPEFDGTKVRFRVLAAGKPVAAEVNMMMPGDKKEKVTADAEGYTKWIDGAGRYGAWARHVEAAAGEAGGKKFAEVRHYATVVVDVAAAK